MMDTAVSIPSVLDQRKEYLESHSTGLGGTDISAVFNLNPWKAPIDIFLGKLGKSQPVDVTEVMSWGTPMEQVIRAGYEHRTGWHVATGGEIRDVYPNSKPWNGQYIITHPEVPCILGTPDGIVPDANRGLEIKNVSFKNEHWGKAGSDEVPIHYLLQCQQYIAITGLPQWDLAALFNGSKLEIFTIQRDEDIVSRILKGGEWFWTEHILKQIPPDVDGSDTYRRYLADCHKIGRPDYLKPKPEIDSVGYDLRNIQAELKGLEARESLCKNQLMTLIGDAAGAHLSDGDRVQWIRSKPSSQTDWEGLARDLGADAEAIADFTKEVQKSAYVRLYQGKGKK